MRIVKEVQSDENLVYNLTVDKKCYVKVFCDDDKITISISNKYEKIEDRKNLVYYNRGVNEKRSKDTYNRSE